MSTDAEAFRETCAVFQKRTGTASHQRGEADHFRVRVVDVRVFWVPSVGSPTPSANSALRQDGQHGALVVQRVMSCSSSEASCPRLPWPESSAGDNATAERLVDAFDDYVAKKLVGPAWTRATEAWVTPVCENMASIAGRIGEFQDQWHDLILGKPVEDWVVHRCLPVSRRSLLHAVASGIGNFLSNTLEPTGSCERDIETARTKDRYVIQMIQDFQPPQGTSFPRPEDPITFITRDAGTTPSVSRPSGVLNTPGQRPDLERTPDAPAARSEEPLRITFGFGEEEHGVCQLSRANRRRKLWNMYMNVNMTTTSSRWVRLGYELLCQTGHKRVIGAARGTRHYW